MRVITRKLASSAYHEIRHLLGIKAVEFDPFHWVENKKFRTFYWDHFLRRKLPIGLEFEMNSLCNRRCSYCPVSEQARPKGYFDQDLFKKIIDELAEVGFFGYIVPNFFGEPLLDKRIHWFVKYAREKLPKSIIFLNTNGDHLTIDGLKDLATSGVDVFCISQHDDEPSEKITAIRKFLKENPYYRKLAHVKNMASERRVLSSRGGAIDEKRVSYIPDYGCFNARRAHVTYDGKMVLCCNDYYQEVTFGNVFEEGLLSIWRGSLEKRREIFLGNYEDDVCKGCAGMLDRQKEPNAGQFMIDQEAKRQNV